VPTALLLTALPTVEPSDNATLLAPALRDRGWAVTTACIDGLRLEAGGVVVADDAGTRALADADLVWVLGFGRREGFLDKMQLLARAPARVRFVNRIDAILSLHGKYPFADAGADFPQPETWAAAEAAPLVAAARAGGGRWVLKPPGGSFGRDVEVLDAADPDLDGRIAAAVGDGHWRLLQRWIPEVADGEHRVIVAGGRVIGGYRRAAADGPANLAAGGSARIAAPDAARDALAGRAAAWLGRRGIAFAGLDLAGPWVLEANIVNPGGLGTLRDLDGIDRAPAVVDALL
jgi:glutathione synthase